MPDSSVRPSLEHQPPVSDQPSREAPDWGKVDSMLEELPPGVPVLPPKDAHNFSKYSFKPRTFVGDEAKKNCVDQMIKYESKLCKAYREEIDTLLVFAGLFSAIVTAFSVESYQWLLDDPNEIMVSLLAQIAQSVGPNDTVLVATPRTTSSMTRSVSTRINVYWFLSLCLSLSTALFAILGKQWVREFEAQDNLPPRQLL